MTENVDLKHIRAFLAVAETLHFGRAAASLGVSQPALSRMIRWLETELGTPLFERTTREVALTPVGLDLAQRAPKTVADFELLLEHVQNAAIGKTGHLTVGYMDFAINGSLPPLLRRYREQEPGIDVELVYQPTTFQRKALLDGGLDVGFLIGPLTHAGIATTVVEVARLVALLPRDHKLAKAKRVSLQRLADEPWVLGAPQPWQAFRAIVDDVCADHGFSPRVVQEASTSDGILGLVAAGMGVSLYSDCATNLKRHGVVVKELETPRTIETVAAWHLENANPALTRFLETIQ